MLDALSGDDRGVSTTLGYVLTLTITAVLISGLLFAGGALVEDQRDRIAQEELSVAAEQLAAGVNEGDRLAESTDGGVLRVQVWLPERIAGGSYALELRNESVPPDQPARATIIARAGGADARATVSLRTGVPVANKTVEGGPVVISHRNVTGDERRELVVNESRGLALNEPEPAAMAHDEVVFVDADTKELSSVAPDGTVTRYGVDAAAIGPKQVDIDGDGLREIPFVDSSNRLRVVDAAGEVQTLASDAAKTSGGGHGTLLGIGTWQGETSVFYLNTSDGRAIYRVGIDGDSEAVTVGGTPVSANAVLGVGDINDDGDTDLAYLGNSQYLRYIDDGSAVNTSESVGSNPALGAGAPRQFASGQPDRTPFVASNNVKLFSYAGGTGATDTLTTSNDDDHTYVAGVDWTGNGELEVLFVGNDGDLYYVALGGSPTPVTDDGGTTITVDQGVGVA